MEIFKKHRLLKIENWNEICKIYQKIAAINFIKVMFNNCTIH